MIQERISCRVCRGYLVDILDLGKQRLAGIFQLKGTSLGEKYPLILCYCNSCGLVQLKHTVDSSLLYNEYWYQSGITQTMKNHLKDLAYEAFSLLKLANKNFDDVKSLDIGCNDYTLLNNSWNLPKNRFGIDPSDITSRNKDFVEYNIYTGFYPNVILKDIKFDLITSIACFYDIDNPIVFVDSIRNNLSKDGLWCLEVGYLRKMLSNKDYSSICHEHLCYYTIRDIERICALSGLKIVQYQQNNCNGGSIRCYISYKDCNIYGSGLLINDDVSFDVLKKFATNVFDHRCELESLLDKVPREIHLLGASTKVNTLLQYCSFNNNDIPYASDRDKNKHDRMTSTGIPIISEEESRNFNPGTYLVGPWHFRTELLERERKHESKNKPYFIFPFPEIEVVKL